MEPIGFASKGSLGFSTEAVFMEASEKAKVSLLTKMVESTKASGSLGRDMDKAK